MTLNKAHILYYLCISVALTYGCSQEEGAPRQIDLTFSEVLSITATADGPIDTVVFHPSKVQAGPDGRIYVANPNRSRVHVFSPDGEFLFAFGQSGRGPGEFRRMKGFGIIDSTIYLWDQELQRLNKFNLEGRPVTSYPLKGISSPVSIHEIGKDILLMYPDIHSPPAESTRIAHIYDRGFSKSKYDFILVDNIDEQLEEINTIIKAIGGNVVGLDESRLLFVSGMYNGRVFEYKFGEEGTWQLSEIHRGQVRKEAYYTPIDDNAPLEPDVSFHSVYLNKPMRLLLHSISKGLFLKGDHILHFIQTDIDDQRVFGVEVYNLDLKPYGFTTIASIPLNDKGKNLRGWYVDDMDRNGNFYFRELYRDSSRVRVIQVLGLDK